MIAAAQQVGFAIDLEIDGNEARKRWQDRAFILYDRAVIMQRYSEDGRRHSALRIEEMPGPKYVWWVMTDWTRYDWNPKYLKHEGINPDLFVACLPEIVEFVVPQGQGRLHPHP